jgi:hypothetical protein
VVESLLDLFFEGVQPAVDEGRAMLSKMKRGRSDLEQTWEGRGKRESEEGGGTGERRDLDVDIH